MYLDVFDVDDNIRRSRRMIIFYHSKYHLVRLSKNEGGRANGDFGTRGEPRDTLEPHFAWLRRINLIDF